jgi:hypothetical protein
MVSVSAGLATEGDCAVKDQQQYTGAFRTVPSLRNGKCLEIVWYSRASIRVAAAGGVGLCLRQTAECSRSSSAAMAPWPLRGLLAALQ